MGNEFLFSGAPAENSAGALLRKENLRYAGEDREAMRSASW